MKSVFRVHEEPLERSTFPERIVEKIRNAIEDGSLKPGDRLPSEMELGETFGVGRTSIREALKALVLMGILTRSNAGTFVSNESQTRICEAFAYYLVNRDRNVQNIFEVRRIVEMEIAGLAAERANEHDIAELRAINAEANTIPVEDRTARNRIDTAFHLAMAKSTKNAYLFELCSLIYEAKDKALAQYRQHLNPSVYGWGKSNREQLIEALEGRDPETARSITLAMLLKSEQMYTKIVADFSSAAEGHPTTSVSVPNMR